MQEPPKPKLDTFHPGSESISLPKWLQTSFTIQWSFSSICLYPCQVRADIVKETPPVWLCAALFEGTRISVLALVRQRLPCPPSAIQFRAPWLLAATCQAGLSCRHGKGRGGAIGDDDTTAKTATRFRNTPTNQIIPASIPNSREHVVMFSRGKQTSSAGGRRGQEFACLHWLRRLHCLRHPRQLHRL